MPDCPDPLRMCGRREASKLGGTLVDSMASGQKVYLNHLGRRPRCERSLVILCRGWSPMWPVRRWVGAEWQRTLCRSCARGCSRLVLIHCPFMDVGPESSFRTPPGRRRDALGSLFGSRGTSLVTNPTVSPPVKVGSRSPELLRVRSFVRGGGPALTKIVTWLILPVVICLSQRLSHACLSISNCTAKLRMAH